jgi:hypothetical protein
MEFDRLRRKRIGGKTVDSIKDTGCYRVGDGEEIFFDRWFVKETIGGHAVAAAFLSHQR